MSKSKFWNIFIILTNLTFIWIRFLRFQALKVIDVFVEVDKTFGLTIIGKFNVPSVLGKPITMHTDFLRVDEFVIIGLAIIHQIHLKVDHRAVVSHRDDSDIDC